MNKDMKKRVRNKFKKIANYLILFSASSHLAKNQVLQQAGMSVLAQANALPQQVLALLQ